MSEAEAVNGMVGRSVLVPLYPAIKRTPQVGDSLAIAHVVKRQADGTPLGLMRADRADVEVITCVYDDGTVRTGMTDTWEVKPAGSTKYERGAKWVTVNPEHVNK